MSIAPTSFTKRNTKGAAWFSVTNRVDLASAISASHEIVGIPASNLNQTTADTIYRRDAIVSGDSLTTINFDFGTSVALDVLSFMTTRDSDPILGDQGSTLSGSDTVRHMLSNVSNGAFELYDSGTVAHGMLPGHGIHTTILPSTITARYWTLVINPLSHVAVSPGGFMDIIRAWAGEAFMFDIQADYGAEYEWESNSSVTRAERAATDFVDVGERFRTMTLTFSGILQNEFNSLLEFDRITSGQSQILFGLQQTELGRFSMFCRNTPTGGIAYSNPQRYRKRLRLIESI
jgi:hypothetical protein